MGPQVLVPLQAVQEGEELLP